jgi:pyruvate dehydrogenase E2 component (dihydrolipoamide acetyltransferase)
MPTFLLPDLGEGLTEAEIVTWHVQVGDPVTVDQGIVEVETAKAAVEVPVPFAGRVSELHGQPGDVVNVGEPLVTVDAARPGDAAGPGDATGPFAEPGVVSPPAGPGDAGESGNVLIGYGTSSGRRRRRRATQPPAVAPAPSAPAAGTAATAAVTVNTVPSPASNGRVAVASPLIRQLARKAGVDSTMSVSPDTRAACSTSGIVSSRAADRAYTAERFRTFPYGMLKSSHDHDQGRGSPDTSPGAGSGGTP